MSVDRAEAERIAQLARLRFGDEELTRITAELNRILEYVESLESSGAEGAGHLPTSGAPTAAECPPTRTSSAESPDGLARDLREMAPDWREGFFVVPPLPGVQETEGA